MIHTPDFAPEKSAIMRAVSAAPPPPPAVSPGAHWLVQHCPRLAALVLAELFVAPRRRVAPLEPPVGSRVERLPAGRHVLRVHLLGEGPLVLLVHDWQGGASQFLRLAQGLANAGHRVALFDMPAHGQSPGFTSDLSEFLDVVSELTAQLGPVHALVGHGLGGLAALLSTTRDLPVASVVALAPLPSFEFSIRQFAKTYGATGAAQEMLTRRLERRVGLSRRDANLSEVTPPIPTLIVHDVLDRRVPVRASRQLASGWRNARLMETCGLGHQRILSAPPVVHFVANFLRGFPPPQLC
jgi:pimeloyl-ACP methyl ester carboxylesterase